MAARKISNSETAAWLSCQRKWYYAHSLGIKPKKYGTALSRGIIGHDALAAYYNTLLEDGISSQSILTGIAAAESIVMGFYSDSEGDERKMLLDLITLLNRYFVVDPILANDYEILAVEKQYDLSLVEDEFDYSMRLDLLLKDHSKNEVILWDHKFVYDFWQQFAFDLNPQVPKYMAALRNNGIPVDKAVMSMLRHRVNPQKAPVADLFRQVPVRPVVTEMRQVMKEHIKASRQIVAMRELPIEIQSEEVLRNMSQTTCKNCSYPDPCKSELMGGDIKVMIETYFKKNDYGYNEENHVG